MIGHYHTVLLETEERDSLYLDAQVVDLSPEG